MDILKNKTYKDYTRLSRYNQFPYYYHTLDDKYIYGTVAWLKDSTLYTSHIIKQAETLDSLALKYYNNPTYYWIIASFNHIADPFIKLVPGKIIKIPSISNIEFETQD